jgi:hypothetical protein
MRLGTSDRITSIKSCNVTTALAYRLKSKYIQVNAAIARIAAMTFSRLVISIF